MPPISFRHVNLDYRSPRSIVFVEVAAIRPPLFQIHLSYKACVRVHVCVFCLLNHLSARILPLLRTTPPPSFPHFTPPPVLSRFELSIVSNSKSNSNSGPKDAVDDPFFAAEAESASGAQRTSEQLEREAETATLGSDDSLPTQGGTAESLFERVAGAPLTLWTIPEISAVGLTEEQAFDEGMRKASQGGSL